MATVTFEGVALTACVYCEERPATSRDHVTPRSVRATLFECGVPYTTDVVSACMRCNLLAGARLFTGFEAKREWIRDQLGLSEEHADSRAVRRSERPAPKRIAASAPRVVRLSSAHERCLSTLIEAVMAAGRTVSARTVASSFFGANPTETQVRLTGARLGLLSRAGFAQSYGEGWWTYTTHGAAYEPAHHRTSGGA